jgi:hypothetical protein
MSKSRRSITSLSPRRPSLRGHKVTVIDTGVQRASVRRAKLGFYVTLAVVAAVVTVAAMSQTSTPLAVLIGLVSGLAAGSVVFVIAFCWPAIRVLWHWAFEITLGSALLGLYHLLTTVTSVTVALIVMLLAVGGPFLFPPARHRLVALAWCAITRHRLRLCFTEFIKGDGAAAGSEGRLPFILISRPTPAGERVWIWLRAGFSFSDLEGRYDKIAVATWATEVLASRSTKWAALVQVDITRRNTLATTIASPLTNLIPADTYVSKAAPVSPAAGPSALDLPDVPDIAASTPTKTAGAIPAQRKPTPSSAPAVTNDAENDDTSDWI